MSRVLAAAKAGGVEIEVVRMPQLTRTADEAALACGCEVGRIVKSLIFRGEMSGSPKMLLISGDRRADLEKASVVFGESLGRADAEYVRRSTGFAIGGVSPIGSTVRLDVVMDSRLMSFASVWAAAGTSDSVFEISPDALACLSSSRIADVSVD